MLGCGAGPISCNVNRTSVEGTSTRSLVVLTILQCYAYGRQGDGTGFMRRIVTKSVGGGVFKFNAVTLETLRLVVVIRSAIYCNSCITNEVRRALFVFGTLPADYLRCLCLCKAYGRIYNRWTSDEQRYAQACCHRDRKHRSRHQSISRNRELKHLRVERFAVACVQRFF